MVQAWADGEANHGFAFLSNNADAWTFASSENGSTSLRPYLSINYTVPQAPVVTPSGGAASYTENAAAVAVDPGLTLSDADSAQLTGATVRISANYANGQDVLAFTNQSGITGTWAAATGTLTLSGTATVAQYEAALRSVTYANTSDDPSTATRTVEFTASDSLAPSATVTRNLDVVAVNDAPVVNVVSPRTTNEDVIKRFDTFIGNAITISDVDAGGGQLELSISAVHGTLDLGGTTGLTFSTGDGSDDATVTFRGTLAAINTALDGITYQPDADYNGPAPLSFTLNDLGNTGSGGAQAGSATQDITVLPINDAPTVTTTGGSLSVNENDGAQAVDPGLSLGDVDNVTLAGATVRIDVNYANGQDVLGFTDQSGITGSWDAGTGTLTLSGSATVAQYQAALRSVTYTNTSEDPSILVRTVSFMVTDGSDASNTATRQVQVVSVNDAPTTADASATGAEDAASIAITLSGSDVDGTVDRFNLSTLPANGTLYLDAGLTTLAATGTDYSASAQSLTLYFVPTAHWNGSTGFQFSARDVQGLVDATPATATITVNPVNDAPVIGTSGGTGTYTEGDPALSDPGATLTDIDSADFDGGTLVFQITSGGGLGDELGVRHDGTAAGQIGVSGSDITYGGTVIGTWSGTGDAGTPLTVNLNANASVAATQALLRNLSFRNTSDHPTAGLRQFSVTVSDGDGGTSTPAIASINVVPVNDAPVLTDTALGASMNEDMGIVLRVADLVGGLSDVDNSPLGIALIGADGTHGTWSYSLNAGATWTAVGSVDASQSLLLPDDGGNALLYFAPTAHWHGTLPTALTLRGWDGSSGSAGGKVDTSVNGGATAYSGASDVLSLTVNPVNDAPTGAVTVDGSATEDQTLTANTSALADVDGLGTFSYQWLRDGATLTGATAVTYTAGDADVGHQLSVRVNYVDGDGTAETVTSASTVPIANVNDAPTGAVTIDGSAVEDQTLSANTSALADADGLGALSYQWLRNGVAIGGATASAYTLGDADVGTLIRVAVSYTDGQGTSESITSAATGPVANVNDAPTGAVTISGSAIEDQTLTANTSAVADADGLGTFSVQWLRNGVAIGGATASTYTLGDADVGRQIRVTVSYTDGQGTAESITSAHTPAVANINDAPALVPRPPPA